MYSLQFNLVELPCESTSQASKQHFYTDLPKTANQEGIEIPHNSSEQASRKRWSNKALNAKSR